VSPDSSRARELAASFSLTGAATGAARKPDAVDSTIRFADSATTNTIENFIVTHRHRPGSF